MMTFCSYSNYIIINQALFVKQAMKNQNITDWQSYVSQNYKLTNFTFPFDENMQKYRKFPSNKVENIDLIKDHFQDKMKEEYPEMAGKYKITTRRTKMGRQRFYIRCVQNHVERRQVCRAYFSYIYDENNLCFSIIAFRNEHTHYPAFIGRKQIREMARQKVKQQKKQKQPPQFGRAQKSKSKQNHDKQKYSYKYNYVGDDESEYEQN